MPPQSRWRTRSDPVNLGSSQIPLSRADLRHKMLLVVSQAFSTIRLPQLRTSWALGRQSAVACSVVDGPVPAPGLLQGVSSRIGIPALEGALEGAWSRAWLEQEAEIVQLEQGVDSSSTGDLDLEKLWRLSDNKTDASTSVRQARARELTRELMAFWRSATPATEQAEAQFDPSEELGIRNLSLADARAQRLRLLLRHRRAGLVEYRVVGEVTTEATAHAEAGLAASAPTRRIQHHVQILPPTPCLAGALTHRRRAGTDPGH